MNKQKGLAPILIIILIAVMAVGGYLLYQKQIKPVAVPQFSPSPVVSPVISPIASSSADTANWKTYTNSKYGFTLKYPQNLSVKETSNIIIFNAVGNKDNETVFALIVYENPNNLSLKDYETKNTGESGMGPSVYYSSSQLVTLENGTKVYYQKEEISCFSKCGSYIWINKDKIYKFLGSVNSGIKDQKQIMDQILSTFKFTQ